MIIFIEEDDKEVGKKDKLTFLTELKIVLCDGDKRLVNRDNLKQGSQG